MCNLATFILCYLAYVNQIDEDAYDADNNNNDGNLDIFPPHGTG